LAAPGSSHSESFVELAGLKVHLYKGGAGAPLLVLDHDIGTPGWVAFYEELARHFTVYVPEHPGFGRSERPAWMRSVREMAIVYLWLLREMGLERIAAVGLGFGGWIAADIAMMSHRQFSKMVLVNPMGIQPERGEILDQFIINTIDYIRAGFADQGKYLMVFAEKPGIEQLEAWEINREMTTRIAWKPYMFEQAMPHLARAIGTPTLILHSRQNRIVPANCAERYAASIPGARLRMLDGCGHFAELEKPEELANLVRDFVIG
jgi:pimeloyl-ACP methyl ester carboxylesterase